MPIPSSQEAFTAIYGAWRLFRFDPRGLTLFEDSVPACIQSFFAAVIVAPGFALIRLVDYQGTEPATGFLGILLAETLAYVIIWTAFPLALFYLSRAIGRESRYLLAVTALNWGVVIQTAILLPVYLVIATDVLTPGFIALATLVAFVVTLVYEGYVARVALEISPIMAAWIVGVDVAISFGVNSVVDGLLA